MYKNDHLPNCFLGPLFCLWQIVLLPWKELIQITLQYFDGLKVKLMLLVSELFFKNTHDKQYRNILFNIVVFTFVLDTVNSFMVDDRVGVNSNLSIPIHFIFERVNSNSIPIHLVSIPI